MVVWRAAAAHFWGRCVALVRSNRERRRKQKRDAVHSVLRVQELEANAPVFLSPVKAQGAEFIPAVKPQSGAGRAWTR